MPVELGRTLLVLGRLRRRRNERQQAQECLEQAVEAFESGGAVGLAAVARHELGRATGRPGNPKAPPPTEPDIREPPSAGVRHHSPAPPPFLSRSTLTANLP